MDKVRGVGYIGEGKYTSWNSKRARGVWDGILCRCYSEDRVIKFPSYRDCTVHEDWHNFQNFAKWFEENYIEGWHLDKDILVPGNKIYGPDTCCFVPQEINNNFVKRLKRKANGLPSRVNKTKGSRVRFYTHLDNSRKFSTVDEAEAYYLYLKSLAIETLADKYRELLPERTFLTLTKRRRGMRILLDMDGTCVKHVNPGIGESIGAEYVLRRLNRENHKLILFTMRSSKDGSLQEAVNWFKERGIPLYGIQSNPEQREWTHSPKAYGDFLIDDTALGIPLRHIEGERPFVDWKQVEILLEEKNILRKGYSI